MFGGLIVLVVTVMALLDERAELREEQRARVTAAERLAEQSAQSTVVRARALAEAANPSTDPALLVSSFGDEVSACVMVEEPACTNDDLLAATGVAATAVASAEQGGTVISVDEADQSLYLVSRVDATVVIRLPASALVEDLVREVLDSVGASIDVRPSLTPALGADRVGPDLADGRVVVSDTMSLPGEAGSIEVVASIDDEVGLGGENLTMYVILVIFGGALMALSLWTFIGDRRTLLRRASTDELTGLVNRREFEYRTGEAIAAAERVGSGVCILLVDLNGFKQINDTRGHQIGDQVLQAAAARLKGAVRGTDLVARWGGDEFVILLPGVEDGSGVRSSAERVSRAFDAAPVVGDVTVAAAVGAALFPVHGRTLEELVRAADLAMYGAKSTGVAYRIADGANLQMSHGRAGQEGQDGLDWDDASAIMAGDI